MHTYSSSPAPPYLSFACHGTLQTKFYSSSKPRFTVYVLGFGRERVRQRRKKGFDLTYNKNIEIICLDANTYINCVRATVLNEHIHKKQRNWEWERERASWNLGRHVRNCSFIVCRVIVAKCNCFSYKPTVMVVKCLSYAKFAFERLRMNEPLLSRNI